jgi:predicted amidohydrolase YtcJ
MKADLIVTNGRVYTVEPARPWTEAVACHEGRILAVGTNQEIEALAGSRTKRIDAGGRLVLPGLTDAHVHFLAHAEKRQELNLFGLRRFAHVAERLRAAVAKAQPGEWILGWGWHDDGWEVRPTAALLDEIAPRNPVKLSRMDMHTWWVNSLVLKQAGITAATPDPPESRIERDETGRPTGLLSEWNAQALVEPYIPQPDAAMKAGWLREAIAEAHRLGLTGIHDQRIEREGAESFKLYQALRREGALKLRVHMNVAADFLPEVTQLGLQPGFGDDRLWVGHAKAFADGTMGSRTALMLEPFEGEADNVGVVVTPADELWSLIVAAGESGYSLSVHAIGDRAVRDVLDVMGERTTAATKQLALPHRIEHVQLIHPDDLGRLAAYGIVASLQPVHLLSDWPTADRVWGQRARYAYAFRSLLDRGTMLAFGSDAPVAPLNPLLGIYAAVTRQDEQGRPAGGWYPEERLSVAEAIHGYTMGPAYLAGKEKVQGSITPGKWADLVILTHNLFEVSPAEIATVEAETTIFNGEVVYQRI